MKILIIDNEANIREAMAGLIQNFCPFAFQLFQADGVTSGLKAIAQEKPDIVFLDVELDDGTGMDLLSQLVEVDFHVIFVTAHNQYAINAFRFSAIDFLLKPVNPNELIEAFDKVSRQIKNKFIEDQLQIMQENLHQITAKEKKIVLRDSQSIFFVKVSEIIRCESDGQYTEFYVENLKKIVISKSLKEYEEMLLPFGFIRPHHSHLVNSRKILRMDKGQGGLLVMQNHDEVPVSHRKKAEILQVLDSL